jgi:probable HAF family extracellular repeat protein
LTLLVAIPSAQVAFAGGAQIGELRTETEARAAAASFNRSHTEESDIPAAGHYSSAPVPTISSQTRYVVVFTPYFGSDPVVATPQPLGNTLTNSISPFGIAVSSTDVVSVGASETGTNGPYHAFRFSLASGVTSDLGGLGGAAGTSFAYGISDGTSTIVGASYVSADLNGPLHAFRIGSGGVMNDLGSLAGAGGSSTAFAADGDGNVVVGWTDVPGGDRHAFRWSRMPGAGGVMSDLGGAASLATAVSFDGSVVVGANTVNVVIGNTHTSKLHATLWNSAGVPMDLGVLPGDVVSIATGVSADGTVVVGISDPIGISAESGASGYGYNAATSHAFVWTQATGMQNLTAALGQAGVNITGQNLVAALGVERNGQMIVGAGVFPDTATNSTSGFQARYCPGPCPDDSLTPLAAALPASRSIMVGGTATAFATIINPSTSQLNGCFITPVTPLPATFTYQTTDPATNALTGMPNTPVSIPAGGAQSFVFALTATAPVPPTQITLGFECALAAPAPVQVGLDTLLLSVSAAPVPDIVALAATPANDGILHVAGPNGAGAFSVATVNLGAAAAITASASLATAGLPLALAICQTNPVSGQCLAPAGSSVTTVIGAGQTPTFAVFAAAAGPVGFDPVSNRIFVQFTDAGGAVRGLTSVAVETQ